MVSPMNAGLPNQPGAARYRVGDLRKMGPQTRLAFTDEEGQFVRLGNMLTWNGNYSGLTKNHKGFCIKDFPVVSSNASTSCTGMNFYLVNGQYQAVGGASSIKYVKYGSGGDLSFSNDLSAGLTSNGMTNIQCSALFSAGTVAVGGTAGASNPGCAASQNNGSYTTASGFPGLQSIQHMASNSSNLGMAFINSGVTSGANHIYTTTTGTSWTARTGTGGTSGTPAASYWSPCSGAFLIPILSQAAMNKSTDGYTQTACSLPGSVTVNSFQFDNWKTKAAHSALTTLIFLGDGTLLRTTDGNTFTSINPFANDPYSVQTVGAVTIAYDGSRFILFANGTNTGAPSFWYSEDEGITWIASWAYEVITDSVSQSQTIVAMQLAGTKFLVGTQVGGSNINRIFDMTGQIGSSVAPTKVGSTKGSGDSATSTIASNFNYLKVAN